LGQKGNPSSIFDGEKGTVPPLYTVTNVAEPILGNGSLTAEHAKIAEKNRRIRSKDVVKVSFSTSHFPGFSPSILFLCAFCVFAVNSPLSYSL
jgi:hypothetical protein